MKKTLSAAGLFLFATSAFAAQWTGVVSETGCGAKHITGNAADKACVTKCVKGGAAMVFVTSDGKVFKIDNQDAVTGHEGDKVTINGKMTGDSIHIDSLGS